jgi:hypothetical protein
MVSEYVGSLDQRGAEDQGGGGDVGVRHFAHRGELEPHEKGGHRPRKTGLDRLASLKTTPDEHGDGGHKAQQNPERDRARAGRTWIGGTILRPAQPGEDCQIKSELLHVRGVFGAKLMRHVHHLWTAPVFVWAAQVGFSQSASCPQATISRAADQIQQARKVLLVLPIGDGLQTEVSATAQEAIASGNRNFFLAIFPDQNFEREIWTVRRDNIFEGLFDEWYKMEELPNSRSLPLSGTQYGSKQLQREAQEKCSTLSYLTVEPYLPAMLFHDHRMG